MQEDVEVRERDVPFGKAIGLEGTTLGLRVKRFAESMPERGGATKVSCMVSTPTILRSVCKLLTKVQRSAPHQAVLLHAAHAGTSIASPTCKTAKSPSARLAPTVLLPLSQCPHVLPGCLHKCMMVPTAFSELLFKFGVRLANPAHLHPLGGFVLGVSRDAVSSPLALSNQFSLSGQHP